MERQWMNDMELAARGANARCAAATAATETAAAAAAADADGDDDGDGDDDEEKKKKERERERERERVGVCVNSMRTDHVGEIDQNEGRSNNEGMNPLRYCCRAEMESKKSQTEQRLDEQR